MLSYQQLVPPPGGQGGVYAGVRFEITITQAYSEKEEFTGLSAVQTPPCPPGGGIKRNRN